MAQKTTNNGTVNNSKCQEYLKEIEVIRHLLAQTPVKDKKELKKIIQAVENIKYAEGRDRWRRKNKDKIRKDKKEYYQKQKKLKEQQNEKNNNRSQVDRKPNGEDNSERRV